MWRSAELFRSRTFIAQMGQVNDRQLLARSIGLTNDGFISGVGPAIDFDAQRFNLKTPGNSK
jgi:hypothetical protein